MKLRTAYYGPAFQHGSSTYHGSTRSSRSDGRVPFGRNGPARRGLFNSGRRRGSAHRRPPSSAFAPDNEGFRTIHRVNNGQVPNPLHRPTFREPQTMSYVDDNRTAPSYPSSRRVYGMASSNGGLEAEQATGHSRRVRLPSQRRQARVQARRQVNQPPQVNHVRHDMGLTCDARGGDSTRVGVLSITEFDRMCHDILHKQKKTSQMMEDVVAEHVKTVSGEAALVHVCRI